MVHVFMSDNNHVECTVRFLLDVVHHFEREVFFFRVLTQAGAGKHAAINQDLLDWPTIEGEQEAVAESNPVHPDSGAARSRLYCWRGFFSGCLFFSCHRLSSSGSW